MDLLSALWIAFLAGVYAPLGSPCVIPLYPGFLAFLAGQERKGTGESGSLSVTGLGVIVSLGVMTSMLIFGVVFTTVVQVSLSRFLSLVSPAAFLILAAFSILLILDADMGRYTGGISLPRSGKPPINAFLLGLFFGIVILPCNAVAVIALLAIGTTLSGFLENLGAFLAFGTGMTLPLLAFASLSDLKSQRILLWLSSHQRVIHLLAGGVMLSISLYYLFSVFFPPGA